MKSLHDAYVADSYNVSWSDANFNELCQWHNLWMIIKGPWQLRDHGPWPVCGVVLRPSSRHACVGNYNEVKLCWTSKGGRVAYEGVYFF